MARTRRKPEEAPEVAADAPADDAPEAPAEKPSGKTVRVKVVSTAIGYRIEGEDRTMFADEGDVVELPKGEAERLADHVEKTNEPVGKAPGAELAPSAQAAADVIAQESLPVHNTARQ